MHMEVATQAYRQTFTGQAGKGQGERAKGKAQASNFKGLFAGPRMALC